MNNGSFWKIVAVIVVAYFAIHLVLWLLNVAMNLFRIGITLAIVIGIVWLLVQIFGRKRMVY